MVTEDLIAGEREDATGLVSAGELFFLVPFGGRIPFWEIPAWVPPCWGLWYGHGACV